MKSSDRSRSGIFARRPGRRRLLLFFAIAASLVLHVLFAVPILIPFNLFAAKAPPPEPIPVEIVSLPPEQPPVEAQQPPPPQPMPEPPKPVQLPPATPPPPVTPQQIVVATREEATPPQGDNKPNAAAEKPEPQEKPRPMPPRPQAKPEPPKPEPQPEPEREVTGVISLAKPPAKPRDQITDADFRMPPMVVRPRPLGRGGNSLMPSYPSAARANGLQGRVVLLVTLSLDGRPRHIDIARSSGFDQLDESAVRAVWLWRFRFHGQVPPDEEPKIEIPLDFRL